MYILNYFTLCRLKPVGAARQIPLKVIYLNSDNTGECLRNLPNQRLMIKCLTIIQIIRVWKCWFLRGEKTGVPGENPPSARTNNKLNPQMTPTPRIEPGPHWWETSALIRFCSHFFFSGYLRFCFWNSRPLCQSD